MNGFGTNMERCVLGDQALYQSLGTYADLLGRFVACAPRSLDIAALERQTRHPAAELLHLCDMLCRTAVLAPADGQPRAWQLARNPGDVTLEDAFRCVLEEQGARRKGGKGANGAKRAKRNKLPVEENADQASTAMDSVDCANPGDVTRRDVEMLVMQAAIGINQSILQQLRRFPLDRLKVGVSRTRSSMPASPQMLSWTVALG